MSSAWRPRRSGPIRTPSNQQHAHRRHVIRSKPTFLVLVGALVLGAAACGASGDEARLETGPTAPTGGTSASPMPSIPPSGHLEPGRYRFSSLWGIPPDLDDLTSDISMDVPEGYSGLASLAALKVGAVHTGVSTWAVGTVFPDPCKWQATAPVDGSATPSTDEVVAALANQKGLRVSTPAAVTIDGVNGTYMERTVVRPDFGRCDLTQFRVWLDTGGEERYIDPDAIDLLWIFEVDGAPLVIDASMPGVPSAAVRAELVRIVESLRIDLR